MQLRVASFNVHHGVGTDGVLDLERTAAVVRATGAAVVGLQEVDRHLSGRSGWVDQPGRLAERLGMHVAYGPNIDLDPDERHGADGRRRHYGNAVLSTHPIDAWRNVPLPGRDGAEPRGLLTVRISVEGTGVVVGCTHLQNRAPYERFVQAARVVEVLTPPGAAMQPTVLLGDMNAEPDTPEVRTLTAAFTDAWAVAGAGAGGRDGPEGPDGPDGRDDDPGGRDGPAAGRDAGLTFDAATPHARIDYVLTSASVRPRAAWVVPTDASDHRPVVADLVV